MNTVQTNVNILNSNANLSATLFEGTDMSTPGIFNVCDIKAARKHALGGTNKHKKQHIDNIPVYKAYALQI